MSNDIVKGEIDATGIANVKVGNRNPPMTATLTSTAANRAINLSTNNLATPAFPWPNDAATAGMITTVANSSVSHFQFVGNPGDTYEVR